MFERNLWALVAAAGWMLVVFLHAEALQWAESGRIGPGLYRWIYTGGYLVLGGLCVAAVMRVFPAASPPLGRAIVVLGGAVLDGVEAWLLAPPPGSMRFDVWMAGLLGLALAVLAARLAPESVARVWMGRRERDSRS